MPDYTFVFLVCAWHISWYVNKSYEGDIETITKTDESSAFIRSININYAGID